MTPDRAPDLDFNHFGIVPQALDTFGIPWT